MAYRGARDTETIADKLVIDMGKEISLLSPTETPILTLLTQKGKRETKTPRFEWLEDDIVASWGAINHTEGYLAGDTELVVDDATIFDENDIVQVTSTGELLLVTVVDADTDTITVTRSFGVVAAGEIGDDELMQIIGNVNEEGSSTRTAVSTIPALHYNFTQIFRTPLNITATARSSATWDGGDLAFMRYKKGIEHALEIERALIFGERIEDLTGAHPRRATGGILSQIVTNRIEPDGALEEDAFNGYLAQIFRYGSQTKYLFCSAELISAIAGWARGLLQMRPTDTTGGVSITDYISPYGRLMLVPHRMLSGAIYGNYGLFVDMEDVAYRFLTGRDTKLYANIQSPDYDGEIDEYLTECGLEFRSEAKHGLIHNTIVE